MCPWLLSQSNTEGNPGSGGDFVRELNFRFTFNEGSRRACQGVFIFDDDIFEITENFRIVANMILLPDGTQMPSLPGVTINPIETTVHILDNDGKFRAQRHSISAVMYCG